MKKRFPAGLVWMLGPVLLIGGGAWWMQMRENRQRTAGPANLQPLQVYAESTEQLPVSPFEVALGYEAKLRVRYALKHHPDITNAMQGRLRFQGEPVLISKQPGSRADRVSVAGRKIATLKVIRGGVQPGLRQPDSRQRRDKMTVEYLISFPSSLPSQQEAAEPVKFRDTLNYEQFMIAQKFEAASPRLTGTPTGMSFGRPTGYQVTGPVSPVELEVSGSTAPAHPVSRHSGLKLYEQPALPGRADAFPRVAVDQVMIGFVPDPDIRQRLEDDTLWQMEGVFIDANGEEYPLERPTLSEILPPLGNLQGTLIQPYESIAEDRRPNGLHTATFFLSRYGIPTTPGRLILRTRLSVDGRWPMQSDIVLHDGKEPPSTLRVVSTRFKKAGPWAAKAGLKLVEVRLRATGPRPVMWDQATSTVQGNGSPHFAPRAGMGGYRPNEDTLRTHWAEHLQDGAGRVYSTVHPNPALPEREDPRVTCTGVEQLYARKEFVVTYRVDMKDIPVSVGPLDLKVWAGLDGEQLLPITLRVRS